MDSEKQHASRLPLILVFIVAGLALTFVAIKMMQGEPPKPPPPPPIAVEPPKETPKEPPKEIPKEPPKEIPKEPPKETPVEPPKEIQPTEQDIARLKAALDAQKQKVAALNKKISDLRAAPDTPEKTRRLKLLETELFLEKENLTLAIRQLKAVAPDQVPTGPDRAEQRATWEAAKKEIETLQRASKWSAAVERMRQVREACPDLTSEIDAELKMAESYLDNACSACDKALTRARKELEEKKFYYGYRSCIEARNFVPDVQKKQKEITDLAREVKTQALTSSMVRIPGHAFKLGDPENPVHPLREGKSKTFFMDSTEVTVELFAMYLTETGATPPPAFKDLLKAKNIDAVRVLPVTGVTYAEAEAFAAWAGKRLPTEEEWERAARFIDGRAFPWGDKWIGDDGQAGGNAIDVVTATPRDKIECKPVGSYANGRSAEGVYDLAGNAWEWTATRVEQSVDGAPIAFQVLKGGSFLTQKDACRGFVRLLEEPGLRHLDVGFRCVRDAE